MVGLLRLRSGTARWFYIGPVVSGIANPVGVVETEQVLCQRAILMKPRCCHLRRKMPIIMNSLGGSGSTENKDHCSEEGTAQVTIVTKEQTVVIFQGDWIQREKERVWVPSWS